MRNPQKFSDMDMTGVNIIQGDALNEEDVLRAMEGQDILFYSLEGDVLTMAKNILHWIKPLLKELYGLQEWEFITKSQVYVE